MSFALLRQEHVSTALDTPGAATNPGTPCTGDDGTCANIGACSDVKSRDPNEMSSTVVLSSLSPRVARDAPAHKESWKLTTELLSGTAPGEGGDTVLYD